MTTFREWLDVLADADAWVSAAVVRRRFQMEEPEIEALRQMPGGIAEVAALLGRSPSTIRDYCRKGLLPGAYRQRGRDWRIPWSAITAFHEAEAQRHAAEVSPPPRKTKTEGKTDLGAWRKLRDKT